MTTKPLYTLAEAAERLVMSPSMVRHLVLEGELPAVRIAGHQKMLRIRAEDLEAILLPHPNSPVRESA